MTTATHTPNFSLMGVQELEAHLQLGNITVDRVFSIVQKRIEKRTAEKRSQLVPVVTFRNSLAATLRNSNVSSVDGMSTQDMPVPVYNNKSTGVVLAPISGSDPESVAGQVIANVGAQGLPSVIAYLTKQMVSSSTSTK